MFRITHEMSCGIGWHIRSSNDGRRSCVGLWINQTTRRTNRDSAHHRFGARVEKCASKLDKNVNFKLKNKNLWRI